MRLGMPVETRRVGEHGAAGEDSNTAVGLLGRGEYAKDALAAGDGDAFTLELVDDVARVGVGRRGDDGDGHVVRGELFDFERAAFSGDALHRCTPSLYLFMHTRHVQPSAPRTQATLEPTARPHRHHMVMRPLLLVLFGFSGGGPSGVLEGLPSTIVSIAMQSYSLGYSRVRVTRCCGFEALLPSSHACASHSIYRRKRVSVTRPAKH